MATNVTKKLDHNKLNAAKKELEKTTGELMDILRSKPDAAAFVQENADELQNKTVPELLADLLERKQLTRAAVILSLIHI